MPPARDTVSNQAATFVATSRQVACVVGGEAVILHLDDGVYYSLNAVGARVWSLLEKPHNAEQIVARVLEEFDVGVERCREDVEELLQALEARSLIVRSG